MSVIRIDTAQVANTGDLFYQKSKEVDALISQARSLINSLQGQFTGQRATRIYSDWEAIQPNLVNSIETLHIAGDILKKAAADFMAVDSSF